MDFGIVKHWSKMFLLHDGSVRVGNVAVMNAAGGDLMREVLKHRTTAVTSAFNDFITASPAVIIAAPLGSSAAHTSIQPGASNTFSHSATQLRTHSHTATASNK